MELIEELNRIKLANDIINKDSERLGLRPLQSETIAINPSEETQTLVAEEAEPETTETELKISSGKIMLIVTIIASITLAYALFYFISHRENEPSRLSARKFEKARKNQPALVISSGNFANADEAKKYMDRLSRKLGVELKILKNGSQYSIQIGPSYASKEDAIVVFDELSRYSVRDLSLKLDTYK